MNFFNFFRYFFYTAIIVCSLFFTIHFAYSVYDCLRSRRFNLKEKIVGIIIMFFSIGIGNVIYGYFFTETDFLRRFTKFCLKSIVFLLIPCIFIYFVDSNTRKTVDFAYQFALDPSKAIANFDFGYEYETSYTKNDYINEIIDAQNEAFNSKKALEFQILAIQLEDQKNYKAAYEAYVKAYKFDPNLLLYKIETVRLLKKIGNAKRSENEMNAIIMNLDNKISKNPKDHRSWYYKSICYGYLGELEKSKKSVLKAIKIDNNEALYKDRLAQINHYYKNIDRYYAFYGKPTVYKDKKQPKLTQDIVKLNKRKKSLPDVKKKDNSGLESILKELEKGRKK